MMNTLLASDRGKACKNPWSPIHDEKFCIKAFIYSKLYQRVSPNMTVKDFCDCIEDEYYGVKLCVEMARSYL